MDALLLLHPLASAIGREDKDRGDYYLEPDGRARHRGSAETGALSLRQRLGLRRAPVQRHSPDGPFSLLKLWNRAEAAGRLYRPRP